MHAGSQPLGDAGLVAFIRCGHWWLYPCHPTAVQMHEIARFHLRVACSFCFAAWLDATHARACGTALRVN